MSQAQVVPFRGNKPLPYRSGAHHPLPWTYSNGFIWDANRRAVGETVAAAIGEGICRCVNSSAAGDQRV